jgi:hypothetical protein
LIWRPGNESRNTLFTPGSQDFDASLSKDTHIWESHSLNFRFETFNTLNHPNWNVPANDPRNLATVGVITSAGAMRQLQFALKSSFWERAIARKQNRPRQRQDTSRLLMK